MRRSVQMAVTIGFLSLGCVWPADNGNGNDKDKENNGNGDIKKGETLLGKAKKGGGGSGSPSNIINHGGPVMLGTPGVYYIWYGDWAGNTATTILTDFASTIGGSPYFNINTTYYNSSNVHVSGAVAYKGSTTDNYSLGTALSDAGVKTVVANAIGIGPGKLPSDPNAVYFVLTSQDVNETSGFCTQYCGWHTHGLIGGQDIKYSFIGNAARCPNACAQQTTTSPNGNVGADAMASIIAHELEETVTDPDLNAWYFADGQENADKCAWTFGTMFNAPNGSKYNVTLGSGATTRNYLIQQNWVNSGTPGCTLHY